MSGARAPYQQRVRELIERERSATCGPESRAAYENFHHLRFEALLQVCQRHVPSADAQVLDVGRSALTAALAHRYRHVTTLGLELSADDGGHREAHGLGAMAHLVFDLNRSAQVNAWPDMPGAFDLIVYSETIEHIHVAPEFSLMMLGWMLRRSGRLVVSTPNAAALSNRRRLLRGINPFERIRFFDGNPGHFREYTAAELRAMAPAAGLRCAEVQSMDFYRRGRQRRVASWRDSLIAVYENGAP